MLVRLRKGYDFFMKMKKAKEAKAAARAVAMASKPIVQTALPTMVEFACDPNSSLGRIAIENEIDSIRLSKENTDLLTKVGSVRAVELVERAKNYIKTNEIP
mgnify:CR=1 FL=1